MRLLLSDCLLGESSELRSHHRHAQHFALLFDGGVLQLSELVTHRTPPMVSKLSYSFMTGIGRPYRSSAPISMASQIGRLKSSACNRCSTAAGSVHPVSSAVSIARRKRS